MEKVEQKSLFDKVKKYVELSLCKQLAEYAENKINGNYVNDQSINPSRNYISDIGERISHIDETTIQYLMKLTNDYIRAKKKNDIRAISADIALFAKFGFDAKSLDRMIAEIDYEYDLDNRMRPNEFQERILQTVFTHFNCPGKFPTIKDIQDIVSKFGIDIKSGKTPINSNNFDNPYNYNNDNVYTAIQNGLSIEQIINSKLQLDQIMNLYNAPNNSTIFYSNPGKITSIVPYTNSELEQISIRRAVDLYKVLNHRLSNELSTAKNQLSQRKNQETIGTVRN